MNQALMYLYVSTYIHSIARSNTLLSKENAGGKCFHLNQIFFLLLVIVANIT